MKKKYVRREEEISYPKTNNSSINVGRTPQVSGKSVKNFTGTIDYLVAGTGFNSEITQTFHANVTADKNSACDLTAFTFEIAVNPGLSGQNSPDKNGRNFYKKVAAGINRSALKASFTASPGSLVYINGQQQSRLCQGAWIKFSGIPFVAYLLWNPVFPPFCYHRTGNELQVKKKRISGRPFCQRKLLGKIPDICIKKIICQ